MTIEVNATVRQAMGTGASRRLRKAGRVPAIVYGNGDAQMIELDHNETYYKLRNEAFHASVLQLNLEGKNESVILRDFTMHPFRQQVMHIDFQRVDANTEITIRVPFHFVNGDIAPAVKTGGGRINLVTNGIEITCLPKDLPAFIEVDLGSMQVGQNLRVSELKLPAGVAAAGSSNVVIANVQAKRGGK